MVSLLTKKSTMLLVLSSETSLLVPGKGITKAREGFFVGAIALVEHWRNPTLVCVEGEGVFVNPKTQEVIYADEENGLRVTVFKGAPCRVVAQIFGDLVSWSNAFCLCPLQKIE